MVKEWMPHSKDIGKQINISLFVATLFLVYYYIFDISNLLIFDIMKGVSLFFVLYFFIYSLMLMKKWIDKTYR